jgi:transposase
LPGALPTPLREQGLHQRRRVSAQHVTWLHGWLTRTSGREPPASGLGKACAYWLNHWDALTRFLDDGRLPIDNTEVERQIRALAVGRKNYLFAGSHEGARRAAVLYSLMRSCDLADVNATDWLEDVLVRIAGGWPQSRIGELLPHRWDSEAQQAR